jgi:hypothetical protein
MPQAAAAKLLAGLARHLIAPEAHGCNADHQIEPNGSDLTNKPSKIAG